MPVPETSGVSPELIGAVGAALLALVTAVLTFLSTRNSRALKRARTLGRENRSLRGVNEAALAYIYRLRAVILSLGRKPPPWPKMLAEVVHEDFSEEEAPDDPRQP